MTIHSVAQYTEGLNAQGKHYVNEFAAFMHERFPELNQKISFAHADVAGQYKDERRIRGSFGRKEPFLDSFFG